VRKSTHVAPVLPERAPSEGPRSTAALRPTWGPFQETKSKQAWKGREVSRQLAWSLWSLGTRNGDHISHLSGYGKEQEYSTSPFEGKIKLGRSIIIVGVYPTCAGEVDQTGPEKNRMSLFFHPSAEYLRAVCSAEKYLLLARLPKSHTLGSVSSGIFILRVKHRLERSS
jgi:hypothetical protein